VLIPRTLARGELETEMTLTALRIAPDERSTREQMVREIFGRSPLFRDVAVSAARLGASEDVALDISFAGGPTVFRIVAGSESAAYALLCELAVSMVEVDQAHATDRGAHASSADTNEDSSYIRTGARVRELSDQPESTTRR
jgi:hypothetical protein